VTLCFAWVEGQFADESTVSMWHFEGGIWKKLTTVLNTTTNMVCGRTTSFSPFAVMQKTGFNFSGFLRPVSTACNA
jgi:PGF-pre-PGF domain-containing protein